MQYPELANNIIRLQKDDEELRNKLLLKGVLNEGYHKELEALHINHSRVLNTIIDTIGYPTVELVGKEANYAAWMVLQHSISTPSLMRRCVSLIQEAVDQKLEDPKHLIYLTDRIAVLEDRPQLFGTQFDWDVDGMLSPNKVDDVKEVNKRRKAMCMQSLEEQTKIIRNQAMEEGQQCPKDLYQRNKEMQEWKRKVGWII